MVNPELVVAPLTPFTSDLKVDEAALKREIDYVVEDCGATMVVAAGVEAQEYTYLDLEERKALIRRTVEYVAGRCPVLPPVVSEGDRSCPFRQEPRHRCRTDAAAVAAVRRATDRPRPPNRRLCG